MQSDNKNEKPDDVMQFSDLPRFGEVYEMIDGNTGKLQTITIRQYEENPLMWYAKAEFVEP